MSKVGVNAKNMTPFYKTEILETSAGYIELLCLFFTLNVLSSHLTPFYSAHMVSFYAWMTSSTLDPSYSE